MSFLFSYTSDMNGDGVPEVERISTAILVPNIGQPDGGRKARIGVTDTLDGGAMVTVQTRAGRYDHRGPGRFVLSWPPPGVPDGMMAWAKADYAAGRLVSIRLDHYWRSCQVTSSGLADRKVTIEGGDAGEVDFSGESAWLAADAVHTCGASDTKVWVTNASGVVTPGSGTSLPAGAVQLAVVSIAGDVVTVVTSPSGAVNARLCQILDVRPRQAGDGLYSLEIELQEVR